MKLWLDDTKKPPSPEWKWVKTASAAQYVIQTETVERISFDNDLGENEPEGHTLLDWIECELSLAKFHDATPLCAGIQTITCHFAAPDLLGSMKSRIKKITANRV